MAGTSKYPLDPQPFRDWVDGRLRDESGSRAPEGIGQFAGQRTVEEVALELGIGDRRLFAWRFENKTLDRDTIENALLHAGISFEEVYPPARYCRACSERVPVTLKLTCLWCDSRTLKAPAGRQPGSGKLTDSQIRALHYLHHRGGYTIVELGERIWKQARYSSPKTASVSLGRAFRRRDLPTRARNIALPLIGLARCKETKRHSPRKGERCRRYVTPGSDFCRTHDPARRDEVKAWAIEMRERQAVAA